AKDAFSEYSGTILILCGDVPLLSAETLAELIHHHVAEGDIITVLTTILPEPGSYGRVIKNDAGEVLRIVEARDADEKERSVREINTGIYCVEGGFLFEAVTEIGNRNAQGEYYLTDIVAVARGKGLRVGSYIANDPAEVMGINTMEDLSIADGLLRQRYSRS
ncbi:MAG: sugar phosphate nucleotidyltransferase, partial [Smithellaceae bacterium]|nr:sugar phosphate nucleotidyltransferase [Smithellaceae bacterium]